MKRQNGGYLIIDLSSATLLADLVKAYANGKPVLVYENDKATWCVIKENEGVYTLINPVTTYAISSEGVVTTRDTVLANPELAGTEDGLSSIEINGVKYSVGQHLYYHNVCIRFPNQDTDYRSCVQIITNSDIAFTMATLKAYVDTNGFPLLASNTNRKFIQALGQVHGASTSANNGKAVNFITFDSNALVFVSTEINDSKTTLGYVTGNNYNDYQVVDTITQIM